MMRLQTPELRLWFKTGEPGPRLGPVSARRHEVRRIAHGMTTHFLLGYVTAVDPGECRGKPA